MNYSFTPRSDLYPLCIPRSDLSPHEPPHIKCAHEIPFAQSHRPAQRHTILIRRLAIVSLNNAREFIHAFHVPKILEANPDVYRHFAWRQLASTKSTTTAEPHEMRRILQTRIIPCIENLGCEPCGPTVRMRARRPIYITAQTTSQQLNKETQ